ncbi:MAG: hypothetical protein WDZ30_09045 [Cellvibrionaceae bacterium]
MKASEFLQQYGERKKRKAAEDNEEEKEHSLQENAKQRAKHPGSLNAGTAFDWEDMEDYQRELDRLDKEGPGSHEP